MSIYDAILKTIAFKVKGVEFIIYSQKFVYLALNLLVNSKIDTAAYIELTKMVPIPAVVANNANLPNAKEPAVTSFQNPVPIHDFDELHVELI